MKHEKYVELLWNAYQKALEERNNDISPREIFVQLIDDVITQVEVGTRGRSQNMLDGLFESYWSLLQTVESKTNPEKDVLDKIEVEAAYKIWNIIKKTNLKPRWQR